MDGFADLVTHQYINLITYRRSGEAVATPVWFVIEYPHLYVRSGQNASKVKRIRNNPHVQVAPSDRAGAPLGAHLFAQARILDSNDHARIDSLLNQKYGIIKRIVDMLNGGYTNRDFIEITAHP